MSDDDTNRVNARLGIYGGRGIGIPLDGTDWFEQLQEPEVVPGDDQLARFVLSRIIELELEPRGEVKAIYDEPGGPMAHRYAKHTRKDCIVFRRIVAEYCTELAEQTAAFPDHGITAFARAMGLRYAVLAIANRWYDHRDFEPEWRLQ